MLVVCSHCVSSYRIEPAGEGCTDGLRCAHCRQSLRANAALDSTEAVVVKQDGSATPVLVIATMILAATSALLLCRTSIAVAVPGVGALERFVGLEDTGAVPAVTRLTTTWEPDGLTVMGTLKNPGRSTLSLLGLRITVRDSAAEALSSWASPPPKPDLGPGESVDFKSRLDKLPAAAHDLTVGFAGEDIAATEGAVQRLR
jgi:hypothetical protein